MAEEIHGSATKAFALSIVKVHRRGAGSRLKLVQREVTVVMCEVPFWFSVQ